jgi:hypothetical protein|tara:strand:+ start:5383 stop:5832 length:450 start_codon:yes stop_codon:yes gene_type:complete
MKTFKEFKEEIDALPYDQLDEGILQTAFNFMWDMAGKIPSIAKSRKTEKLTKEFNAFKDKMTPAYIEEWTKELTSKIKSTASQTNKAKENRVKVLKKSIERVSAAGSEKQFVERMAHLQNNLRDLEKFIKTSNRGVKQRAKAAKAKASK